MGQDYVTTLHAMTEIGPVDVEVVVADIARMAGCDAVVNAANPQLLPGSGVCDAIFQAAGREALLAACRPLAPIAPGTAVLTPAFNLPNKAILHVCGPRYSTNAQPDSHPEALLAASYRSVLDLADQRGFESLAIPAISTGAYGFPMEQAIQIAIHTLRDWCHQAHHLKRICLVVRDADIAQRYAAALANTAPDRQATTPLQDRCRGALLGLACGDAVGTTVEFKKRGSFPPVTDMVGGGPFHLRPGQWTDDTSMALCLAASLIETQTFDAQDQMERYWQWYEHGYMSSTDRCFDIGTTTRRALQDFKRTGNPFSGDTDPHSAGNGCIMRLAPVILYAYPDRELAIELAGQSARTTHGAPEAVAATRLFGTMLHQALAGADKEGILLGHGIAPESLPSEALAAIARGDYRTKTRDQIRGSGYVVASLEAALWCFWKTCSYRDAVLEATNLGEDADTTAAICGQVAGAFYGESGLPPEWLERLAQVGMMREMADQILIGQTMS